MSIATGIGNSAVFLTQVIAVIVINPSYWAASYYAPSYAAKSYWP